MTIIDDLYTVNHDEDITKSRQTVLSSSNDIKVSRYHIFFVLMPLTNFISLVPWQMELELRKPQQGSKQALRNLDHLRIFC